MISYDNNGSLKEMTTVKDLQLYTVIGVNPRNAYINNWL